MWPANLNRPRPSDRGKQVVESNERDVASKRGGQSYNVTTSRAWNFADLFHFCVCGRSVLLRQRRQLNVAIRDFSAFCLEEDLALGVIELLDVIDELAVDVIGQFVSLGDNVPALGDRLHSCVPRPYRPPNANPALRQSHSRARLDT